MIEIFVLINNPSYVVIIFVFLCIMSFNQILFIYENCIFCFMINKKVECPINCAIINTYTILRDKRLFSI